MAQIHAIRHKATSAVLYAAMGAAMAAWFSPTTSRALFVRATAAGIADGPGDRHAQGTPIVLRRDGDGLFYLTALINGRPIRFVVDTGASVVVLSAADAARAGVVGNIAANGITTANGNATMRWAQAGSIRIGAQHFADVPVTVAPQSTVSLIGESLISKFDRVTIAGDTMVLH